MLSFLDVRELISVSVATMGVLLQPAIVRAQQPASLGNQPGPPPLGPELPDRPFRGLFQPVAPTTTGGQSLVFNASLYGAYDEDLASGFTGAADYNPSQASGAYSGASANLAYAKQTQRVSIGLRENTSTALQEHLVEDRLLTRHKASADLGVTFHQWTLAGHGGIGYSPYLLLGVMLPEQVERAADAELSRQVDYSLSTRAAVSADLSGSLGRIINNRTSLSATYTSRRVTFVHAADELVEQTVGARLTHRVGAGVSARLGYGYRSAQTTLGAESQPWRGHDIDVGLAYDHALSLSRRTRLSLSSGSTLTQNTALSEPTDSTASGRDRYFIVTGDAQLTHEMGRTWGATAAYRRAVQFSAGFSRPFLANTASTAVGGFITSRVHLGVSGYYSFGALGLDTRGNQYSTLNGTGSLIVPVASKLAVFAEYFYYRYGFQSEDGLPAGMSPKLDRQGGRVGLRLSVPLLASGSARTRQPSTDRPVTSGSPAGDGRNPE